MKAVWENPRGPQLTASDHVPIMTRKHLKEIMLLSQGFMTECKLTTGPVAEPLTSWLTGTVTRLELRVTHQWVTGITWPGWCKPQGVKEVSPISKIFNFVLSVVQVTWLASLTLPSEPLALKSVTSTNRCWTLYPRKPHSDGSINKEHPDTNENLNHIKGCEGPNFCASHFLGWNPSLAWYGGTGQ